jgi:short-subunit dehydrogenase
MIAPRSVVITGASSGLGEVLALRYAARGARLGLIGRNAARLEAVAERARQTGAAVAETAALDVRDRTALAAWIAAFDDLGPVDLLIANAGVVGGTGLAGEIERAEDSERIFAINVGGTVNTIHAILPRMVARRAGQIAVVSSLAGFVRLPDLPSYSASKAAIMSYALNLRDTLGPLGVSVNVVCPGYVDTPMARQLMGTRMFEVTPAYAAAAIERGLARNRRIVAFPFALAAVTRIASVLPGSWVRTFAPSFRVAGREND